MRTSHALMRRGVAFFPDRTVDGRAVGAEARFGIGRRGIGWYTAAGLRVDDASAHDDYRPYASPDVAATFATTVWPH